VSRLGLTIPFLRRFPSEIDAGERLRVEKILAVARLFLSSSSLIAVYMDPTEPARYERLAYLLMAAYVVHSVIVFAWVQRSREVSERFAFTVQAIDIAWPALISLFTEGPNSPFFPFFFCMLSAAFRWGFVATAATALFGVATLFVEGLLLSFAVGGGHLIEGEFEVNRLVLRSSYLLIMGVLVGIAAEQEKQLRAEDSLIAKMTQRVRFAEGSLRGTMHQLFDEMARLFDARAIMVVIEELATGRAFLWEFHPGASLITSRLNLTELDAEGRVSYLFPAPASSWHARRRSDAGTAPRWQITGMTAEGQQSPDAAASASLTSFADKLQCRSLIGATVQAGTAWMGNLLIVDPTLRGSARAELGFVRKMLRSLLPAVYNHYLVRKMRSRAGAIERARAARELHDGAIQSLIAAEMQVEVLRRRTSENGSHMGDELDRLQRLLRSEVLSLRELMQQMKPADVGPRDLLEYLANMVDRFRRDTGIDARFVSRLDEIRLPARTCREIARITQEALVNVRKHSGAVRAVVRLSHDDTRWKLEVEDDGRGFSFAGRLTGDELAASSQGPLVIRERVHSIGGQLIVESTPGRGARIQVELTQPASVIYG